MRFSPIPLEPLDLENFLRFGEIVELRRPDPGRAARGEDEYRSLARVPSNGWKIGLACVRARWTDCLYAYNSRRLLTPQGGILLLCAAPPDKPQNVQIFVLDRPVALNAGIPHFVLTLTAESWLQVCEDFEAQSEQVRLRKALVPAGTWE